MDRKKKKKKFYGLARRMELTGHCSLQMKKKEIRCLEIYFDVVS